MYERGCASGSQHACAGLARHVVRGRGLPVDVERGEQLAQTACTAGEPLGCYELAMMYETLLALRKKNRGNELAVPLYRKACDGGNVDACGELAMVYSSGRSRSGVDIDRALALLARACKLGDSMSCMKIPILERRQRE